MASSTSGSRGGQARLGLYDGFEGYRTPAKDDLIEAVRSSLVVLDTNVLLNLYDVHGTTLDDFIKGVRRPRRPTLHPAPGDG